MLRKITALILAVSLIITQPVFAQGVAELNIGKYLNQMPVLNTDSFRPAHLRYISYDIQANDFKLLLDQGDLEKSPGHQVTRSPEKSENALKNETKNLFNYFLIGLSLPNDKFWVNLRPDAPEQIIDPELEKTDMGKIMLEADLQLKKDTAGWTSPQNPEGKEYWDKLYKRAGELFGTENITIPTITRPWIVPGEVIIREGEDSAYIYKANLKVMLEEDYLTGRGGSRTAPTYQQYAFSDPRMKELNKYSTQLIKELILPKLTQEINTAKKYAQLRQVFFSLILSRWFKDRFKGKPGQYSSLIDSHNLDNLTSKEPWSKDYYFSEYKKSFQQGEYNLKEQITTPTGQVIRSYMSGGTDMTGSSKPLIEGGFKAGSPLSEDKLDNIFDTFVKAFIVLGFVYLVYPKSLYPTFIRPTKLEVVLSKQDDFDARRAVANLLNDKQLQHEDRIKLSFYLANYAALENKELLRSTEEALGWFNNKQGKYTITSRLETIIKILKKTTKGSSPLVVPEEDFVAHRENTEQMAKKFYDTYIMNGEYKEYPAFSNAKNAQDIKNILTSIFKNQMLTNYPDAGNKAKVAREIIEEYFLIEFNAEHLKDSIVMLKKAGASSAVELENEFRKVKGILLEKFKGLNEALFLNNTNIASKIKDNPRLVNMAIENGPFTRGIKESMNFRGLMDSVDWALRNASKQFQEQQLKKIREEIGTIIKPLGIQLQFDLFEYINEYVLNNPAAASKLKAILQRPELNERMFDGLPPLKKNEVIAAVTEDVIKHVDSQKAQDFSEITDAWEALSEFAKSSSALTEDLSQNTDSVLIPGGIDFTHINYLTRPMGSFQGLDLRLPLLSKAELEGIDIKQELAALEQMINAKIDVSTDRLKRLLAAMSQKDAFTSQRETQLLPLLLRLCWLKEEKGTETTPDFRAVLLIADTGLFVEQGNTRHSLN